MRPSGPSGGAPDPWGPPRLGHLSWNAPPWHLWEPASGTPLPSGNPTPPLREPSGCPLAALRGPFESPPGPTGDLREAAGGHIRGPRGAFGNTQGVIQDPSGSIREPSRTYPRAPRSPLQHLGGTWGGGAFGFLRGGPSTPQAEIYNCMYAYVGAVTCI